MATVPKSILKKTNHSTSSNSSQEVGSTSNHSNNTSDILDDLNTSTDPKRRWAIQQALLLEHRKHIEALILRNLETLIDFPPHSTDSIPLASQPTVGAKAIFTRLIAPFQVSDYDALIDERHGNNKCGYVFCPLPPRPAQNKSRLRIDAATGQLRVLPLEHAHRSTDKWCSAACARRAMFVKVQLSEVPAWERIGTGTSVLVHEDDLPGNPEMPMPRIQLLTSDGDEALQEKMQTLDINDGAGDSAQDGSDGVGQTALETDRLQDAMRELALERGETEVTGRTTVATTARMASVMHDNVQVRETD